MIVSRCAPVSFSGRFITTEKLSAANKAHIEKFLDYRLDGISNREVLGSKPFDVFIKQVANEADRLKLTTQFKLPSFLGAEDYYISSVFSHDEFIHTDSNAFRCSLKCFENSQKQF